MNPRYCAIQDVLVKDINEMRKVVLQRLLEMVYQFVFESKEYGFCLEMVTIFAEERFGYYKLFRGADKKVIKRMLDMAKDAKIEMIRIRQGLQRRNGQR